MSIQAKKREYMEEEEAFQEEEQFVNTTCFLVQEVDTDANPYPEEIRERALEMGMDPIADKAYLYLARESLTSAIPQQWKPLQTSRGEHFYVNILTKLAYRDHPADIISQHAFDKLKGRPYKHFSCFSLASVSPRLPEMVQKQRVKLGFDSRSDSKREQQQSLLDVIREVTERDEEGSQHDTQRLQRSNLKSSWVHQKTKEEIRMEIERQFEERLRQQMIEHKQKLQAELQNYRRDIKTEMQRDVEDYRKQKQKEYHQGLETVTSKQQEVQLNLNKKRAELENRAQSEAELAVENLIKEQVRVLKKNKDLRLKEIKGYFTAQLREIQGLGNRQIQLRIKARRLSQQRLASYRLKQQARLRGEVLREFRTKIEQIKQRQSQELRTRLQAPIQKDTEGPEILRAASSQISLARERLRSMQQNLRNDNIYETPRTKLTENYYSKRDLLIPTAPARDNLSNHISWETGFRPRLSTRLLKKIF